MVYYAALLIFGAIYWVAEVLYGAKARTLLELTLTIAFAIAPLTLTVYGDIGPV